MTDKEKAKLAQLKVAAKEAEDGIMEALKLRQKAHERIRKHLLKCDPPVRPSEDIIRDLYALRKPFDAGDVDVLVEIEFLDGVPEFFICPPNIVDDNDEAWGLSCEDMENMLAVKEEEHELWVTAAKQAIAYYKRSEGAFKQLWEELKEAESREGLGNITGEEK